MSDVHNNNEHSSYEIVQDGHTAYAAYQIDGDTITLTHTVVPDAFRGQGIGSKLVEGALGDVRSRGLKVAPQCSFVAAYIARHPEWKDLLA